ncbi:helix-turn-helix domain-containing protein [Paraburkholderia madseniana]
MENCRSSEIAPALLRSRSTISRELMRNDWKPERAGRPVKTRAQ